MNIIRPLVGILFGLILRLAYSMAIDEQVPFEVMALMTFAIILAVMFGIVIGLIF